MRENTVDTYEAPQLMEAGDFHEVTLGVAPHWGFDTQSLCLVVLCNRPS